MNWDACLTQSRNDTHLPFWEEGYRRAFPDFQSLERRDRCPECQKHSVDHLLRLRDGRKVKIDTKVRWQPYNDILLEIWSVVRFTRRESEQGWAIKASRADYFAYAVAPLGLLYLLPALELRRVLLQDRCTVLKRWVRIYGWRSAHSDKNGKTWTTRNVPVPTDVLFQAITDSLKSSFTPMEQRH
jgi:hypothetical protein